MQLALSFADPHAPLATLAGGKGANLAKLTQAGLPVPNGFVVTAEAYSLFERDAAALLEPVDRFPFTDSAALELRCEQLVGQLVSLPVPAVVIAAIREQLQLLALNTPVSVRSSATTEDLGGAAFAGQHDTYLNVLALDDIVDKVRHCWASLWSGRAVVYRRGSGFTLREARMAVVVQRMAFCDSAGVGFSFNPISGNLREQVFDANHGLGESVVGGEAQIDHFVVEKATGNIVHAAIAEKHEKIVAAGAGTSGTRTVELTGAERTEPCLTAAQVKELSQLLVGVERLYGFPQDIEWGFENGQVRLLQSRPITRIPARWTREESAERFPSVITPLAWALVEDGFHRSLNYSFALMGMPPFHGKWFAMFGHYIYGNQNAVEVYANGAASHLRIASIADIMAALPTLREQYGWVLELPLTWSRDLDHYLIQIGELMSEDLERSSTAEVWDFVKRVRDLGAEYFLPNIAISITQRTLYRVLHGLLQMAAGAEQAPVLFDRLLAYCETKTGAINKELHRFARRIAQLPALVAQLESTDAAEFLRRGGFEPHPALQATFNKFLRDHGHREVEFDPYHPTWIDAPELVVENLKAMLHSQREDPAIKERELKIVMAETESVIVSRVPEDLRFLVREIIRLARVYTSLDDVEHYQTTRLTLPLRKGLKMLGVRLRVLGVIDDPMDVYFAQYEPLDNAVKANNPDVWHALRIQIQAEKAAYLQRRNESPAWESGAPADAASQDAATASEGLPAGSGVLKGLAGSPGTASGPVFRVFGSEDFGKFPQGAVLVARTTNPAWTPLFFKAAAVITECGGPLSHGAVTAREIGLPAVMSVRGVLAALENGEVVTVNGTTGHVVRQKEAA
jgi:rifampicin phosphotransferase